MPAPIQNCDVTFAFECPKEWSALTPTERDNVRSCATCSKDVHLCQSTDEAAHHAHLGHCVALVTPETSQHKLDRIRRPRVGLIVDVSTPEERYRDEFRQALRAFARTIDEERQLLREE